MTVHPGIAIARDQFARGAIDMDEFERRVEPALLYEAGRAQPVPDGWSSLPECNHEWIEITGYGDSGHRHLCAHCADERWLDS